MANVSQLYDKVERLHRQIAEVCQQSSEINIIYLNESFKTDMADIRSRDIVQIENNIANSEELLKLGRRLVSLERKRREAQDALDRGIAEERKKEERKKKAKRLTNSFRTAFPLR